MPQDNTKHHVYFLKKFFGDELQMQNVTAKRLEYVTVLSVLYLVKPPHLDVASLIASTRGAEKFGLVSFDQAECQQIVDELVRLNLVEEIDPTNYRLSDQVRTACDNALAEFEWAGWP